MTSDLTPTNKPLLDDGSYQYKPVGTIYDDTIPILIHEDVLEQIVEFSEQDLRRERGGFLIGDQHEAGRTYVEVKHFLPAEETQNRAATLKFTFETWSAARRDIEEQFPDDRIVGWHHTHPGFGIFLSPYDRFIHKHYFTQPWQVALVVDPRRGEFGFFQWRHNEVVDCGFVCVYPKKK